MGAAYDAEARIAHVISDGAGQKVRKHRAVQAAGAHAVVSVGQVMTPGFRNR
ncbi:hypothetical protein [Streptomyces litmocidini]|uniref:Uncharacterized protein n=1 Tax=Streptomyces litmocidini TaxID=67318 RepID=A0ABW7UE96_9ACTN